MSSDRDSLPGLRNLFKNSVEQRSLTRTVGSAAGRDAMAEILSRLPEAGRHPWRVSGAAEATERADDRSTGHPYERFLGSR